MASKHKKTVGFFDLINKNFEKRTDKIIFVILFCIMAVLFLLPICTVVDAYLRNNPTNVNTIGDLFKCISQFIHQNGSDLGEFYAIGHSFFEAMAFLALFFTVCIQMKDNYRRDKRLDLQQFQNIFFPALSLFQTYMDNLQHGSLRGRRIFHELHRRVKELELLDKDGKLKDSFANSLNDLDLGWHYALEIYVQRFGMLLSLIVEAGIDVNEKRNYFEFLKAQLTKEEDYLLRVCLGVSQKQFVTNRYLPSAFNIQKLLNDKIELKDDPKPSEDDHKLAECIREFFEFDPQPS